MADVGGFWRQSGRPEGPLLEPGSGAGCGDELWRLELTDGWMEGAAGTIRPGPPWPRQGCWLLMVRPGPCALARSPAWAGARLCPSGRCKLISFRDVPDADSWALQGQLRPQRQSEADTQGPPPTPISEGAWGSPVSCRALVQPRPRSVLATSGVLGDESLPLSRMETGLDAEPPGLLPFK